MVKRKDGKSMINGNFAGQFKSLNYLGGANKLNKPSGGGNAMADFSSGEANTRGRHIQAGDKIDGIEVLDKKVDNAKGLAYLILADGTTFTAEL